MNRISSRYEARNQDSVKVAQDFNTLRQALNVASADQRLLVIQTKKDAKLTKKISQVLSDKKFVGKFHFDTLHQKTDSNWKKVIQGEKSGNEILIVRSDQFGLKGDVLRQLKKDSDTSELGNALEESNRLFAQKEKRKTYQKHVSAGLRKGIYFENKIPYGEDRDGDGKADRPRRRR